MIEPGRGGELIFPDVLRARFGHYMWFFHGGELEWSENGTAEHLSHL